MRTYLASTALRDPTCAGTAVLTGHVARRSMDVARETHNQLKT
jgi:hypothetical protein